MALKSTSSPIVISTRFAQGVANAFEVVPVDLQLNPLDQEVFVVTAAVIDFDRVPGVGTPVPGDTLTSTLSVAVCKQRPSAMQTIGDSNCITHDKIIRLTTFDGSNNPLSVSLFNDTPFDTPPSQVEYLDIIATDSFFIALDGANTDAGSDGAVRIFGYRARADAATYAALVQSEMLSQ